MNDATITGALSTTEYAHTVGEEDMYSAYVTSERTSGTVDTIPILIPKYLVCSLPARARVVGEFRSHNTEPDPDTGRKHLSLYLYAQNIFPAYGIMQDESKIHMQGYVCKTPVTRITPKGRTVTDILLAVPRSNMCDRSDYIPVIVWGNINGDINIGSKLDVRGRMQSRTHNKGVAYEVSVGANELTILM